MVNGHDLRTAREAVGLSLATLAQTTGKSSGHLSRTERGERLVTPPIVAAYERALGTKIDPGGGTVVDTQLRQEGDEVERRKLLAAIAAASMGGVPSEPLSRLLDGLASSTLPSRVGDTEVQAVRQATNLFTSWDMRGGGYRTACEMAKAHLRWAVSLLDQSMTDEVRAQLNSAIAALADRVAWTHYDTGTPGSASRLYTLALRTAADGDDPNLRAHVLLDTSSNVCDLGSPRDAAEIIRLGLGDERLTPAVRANLHGVCARHLASAGDSEGALRHIGQAEEALATADPGHAPEWGRRFLGTPGHFDSVLGLALFAANRRPAARQRLARALDAFGAAGRVRTGLRCRVRLASLHLKDGHPDVGEQEARAALVHMSGVSSVRVIADLRQLRADTVRYPALGDLRADLDTILR
ncbi:helix-turn-helix transcriptional regulator [Longispora sp. NPDC051575]|uniref:helix-turn-helix domain-containing protein n=1 Tax=Longispora sp. NPDC051575 TaxID=3154943 RepID=UPI00342ABEBE